MTDRDDHQPMDLLDRATAALRDAPTPDGPQRQLVASTVEALQSPTIAPPAVRIFERKQLMVRIARYGGLVAAVTLIAFLVSSLWFVDRTASTAFANVIENVRKADSLSFLVRYQFGSQPELETKFAILGDVVRFENPGATVIIVDTNRRKGLQLDTKRKVAWEHDLVGAIPETELKDPIDRLRNLKGESAERLGDEQLGDRNCHVYWVKDATALGFRANWKLWVDPMTALPVKMHIADDTTNFTFEQFKWNEPLDARLFKLETPEGYAISQEPPGRPETIRPKPVRGDRVRGTAVSGPGRVAFAFHEFDEATKTLSVRIRGTGLVIDGFRLADNTQLFLHVLDKSRNDATVNPRIDELNQDLYDAGQGMPVTLDVAEDGTVTKLESYWYDVDCLLNSVNVAAGTITLTSSRGNPPKEITVPVRPDAQILIDGKLSKFADLKAGMALVIQLRPPIGDRQAVARIEATSLQFEGQLEAVDAAKNTVSARGTTFAVKELPVAHDAKVLVDGEVASLSGLSVGKRVSIQLKADPDRIAAIVIRVENGDDE